MRRTAAAVAASVLAVTLAACGSGDDGEGGAFREPTGPAVATVAVESGNLFFDPDAPTVDVAGARAVVEIELDNAAGLHTLVFTRVPGFQLEVSGTGDRDSAKVRLRPGRYEFYCDVPGHRSAGMEGVLTVR